MAAPLGDPQVMRYYLHPKSREEAPARIAWSQGLYRDHGVGRWLVALRENGEFVGDCGLDSPCPWLGASEWAASEAALCLAIPA
jgi:RimJ/RimL family protein N-acetyltransferase